MVGVSQEPSGHRPPGRSGRLLSCGVGLEACFRNAFEGVTVRSTTMCCVLGSQPAPPPQILSITRHNQHLRGPESRVQGAQVITAQALLAGQAQ